MDERNKLIDTEIVVFYESIKDLFEYKIKNEYKEAVSSILLGLVWIYVFLNILPAIPASSENYLSFIFSFLDTTFGVQLDIKNFYSRWIIGVIFSTVVLLPFLVNKIYWSRVADKRFIDSKKDKFCYLYSMYLELKSFITNERPEHLHKSVKYFNEAFRTIEFYALPRADQAYGIIPALFGKDSTKEFGWFKVTPETEDILKAIKDSRKKIVNRLLQKIEIDKLFPAIEYLILYEFSRLKPNVLNSENQKIGELSTRYLTLFSNEVNKLSIIERASNKEERKIFQFKKVALSLSKILTSSHIITLFISWLILLSVSFFIIAQIMITIFAISLDSTIITGLFTATFLGSITISVTIYTKKQEK